MSRRAFYFCASFCALFAVGFSARAVEYTLDTSYAYPGQTASNSGRGLTPNPADTRLFAISRGSSASTVHILDAADGTPVATITPVSAGVNDVAVSADGNTVYMARSISSTEGAVDTASATGGDSTVLIEGLGAFPVALALVEQGADAWLGIATNRNFQIWKRGEGNAWTQTSLVPLATNSQRDIAVVGTTFFLLTGSGSVPNAMQVFNTSGEEQFLSWDDTPNDVGSGYSFLSVTAGVADGADCLFIAGETAEPVYGDPRLTVFRYGTDGKYKGDGFGYDLSFGNELADLVPIFTGVTTYAPGGFANGHLYLGAVLNGTPKTARIAVESGSGAPGRFTGTITLEFPPAPEPLSGAVIVADGGDFSTVSAADGTYALENVPSGSERKVGAWKTGYAAVSKKVNLAPGQIASANFAFSEIVPVLQIARATTPPTIDGLINAGEWANPVFPFFTRETGESPHAAVATRGYVMYDEENLYVAVSAQESDPPTIASATMPDQTSLLIEDDSIQILIDPPHRHDISGANPNLFQFAVNVPPSDFQAPAVLERRINADGTTAADIASGSWQTAQVNLGSGWSVEARIPLATLGIATPFTPTADTVWGLLLARNRPQYFAGIPGHLDGLPTEYSTSCALADVFSNSRYWDDITFVSPATPAVTGDINGNGALDTQDIFLALRVAAGLNFGTSTAARCSDLGRLIAVGRSDVYPTPSDGAITLGDVALLLRSLSGLGG
jgi:hypothetical protein